MREMKDSGIYDVDYVPTEWTIKPLKYVCTMQSGDNLTAQEIEEEGEFPVYGGNGLRGYFSAYNVKGMHVLIGRQGALCGNIHVVEGKYWATDHAVVVSNDSTIDTRYLGYLLQTMNLNQYSVTAAQPGLSVDKIIKLKGCFPLISEQKSIADFLDSKCAEIDALCADIESEIETLEAYKRSVITEAVTKGLDKNVPMKDSGTIWLGRIPESWEVSRIAAIYRLRTTKVSDWDFEPLSVTMKGIVPQLESAAKTNAHDDRKLVRKGDFVINSRSDRRGSCGIAKQDGSVSLINTVLAPLDDMNPEYYDWLFHTVEFADEFYKWGHGIVDDLWTTGWQDMKRIIIPFPSSEEQEEIANYLNDKCHRIDSIIAQKQEQLTVLADYKKSVIYEYVTGKKEVPA